MLKHGIDLRSPGKWSKADRQRTFDSASVSTMWTSNPFGIRPVTVFIHTAIGYTVYKNNPPQEGTFNRAVYDLVARERFAAVDANNTDPTPDTKLYLIDPGNPRAAVMFANLLVDWFPWAHWHMDFASNYLAPPERRAAWDAGLALAVERFRWRSAGRFVIGQEWHRTPPDIVLGGWCWEQYPWKFLPAGSDWKAIHDADVAGLSADTGVNPLVVVELAGRSWPPKPVAQEFTPQQIAEVSAWCESRGYRLSAGRDEMAGVL